MLREVVGTPVPSVNSAENSFGERTRGARVSFCAKGTETAVFPAFKSREWLAERGRIAVLAGMTRLPP
jgi:hypothetical protein